MATYVVSNLEMISGEQFAVIKDIDTGMPIFDAMVWVTTTLRAAGNSPNSIAQALRSIAVMQQYLDSHDINLEQRLQEGRFLTQHEATGLATECKSSRKSANKPDSNSGTTNLKNKGCQTVNIRFVKDSTAAIRCFYITKYLQWKLDGHLLRVGIDSKRYHEIKYLGERSISGFSTLPPKNRRRIDADSREGLPPESKELLLSITKQNSPKNPWKDEHTIFRNHLIIQWMLSLGIRAGELLGIRVSDISTSNGTVKILRRPDNIDDPRLRRGRVKTNERELTLPTKVTDLTRTYILQYRRIIPGARKHEFLFVASKTGKPLSYSALAKIFSTLTNQNQSELNKLVSHVLRHTWNDDFSKLADQSKMNPNREKKIRSYLMGWSENSNSAATYTRRHTRRDANDFLTSQQSQPQEKK